MGRHDFPTILFGLLQERLNRVGVAGSGLVALLGVIKQRPERDDIFGGKLLASRLFGDLLNLGEGHAEGACAKGIEPVELLDFIRSVQDILGDVRLGRLTVGQVGRLEVKLVALSGENPFRELHGT